MIVNNMVYYVKTLSNYGIYAVYLNIDNHSKIIQEHKNYFDD